MKKFKLIGQNFLHTHPFMEQFHNIDDGHIIVDKDEYQFVIEYLCKNMEFAQLINPEIKSYKSNELRSSFEFDIYYSRSCGYPWRFPYYGYLLQEDILIDDKLIPKGYMLFYFDGVSYLEILSPEQWGNDYHMECYKVNKKDHQRNLSDNYFSKKKFY